MNVIMIKNMTLTDSDNHLAHWLGYKILKINKTKRCSYHLD